MSTWLYLACDSHEPPLVADDESGQHLTDLPQIRADLANRDLIVKARELDYVPDATDHFRRGTANFLARHASCDIGIVDEDGRRWPITEETDQ